MAWKRVFRVIAVTAVCTLSLFCLTQNTDSPSLGEIARQKKIAATAKAKRVVTDENLGSQRGAIPSIALEGVNNAEEIVAAVREFKKHHNEIETEEAVRLWYDDADNIMLKAIDEQSRLTARKEDRNLAAATGETFTHPSDYRAAVELRNSEIRQDRSDYRSYYKNGTIIGRTQQTMMKVRDGLREMNLRYDWFKIRNGNGVGSF